MPYSDLHRMAKGKWESTHSKMNNFSNDLAFVPDQEFVELLWENGQIVMQGQTSRTRKGSLSTGFSSHAPKSQQNDGENAVLPVLAKSGRYGHLDSVIPDVTSSGPGSNSGLVQDDEMVPWLNYPLDDSFERDYCSEFFSELSGINLNSISGQTNAVPTDKSGSFGQATRDSHIVSAQPDANLEPVSVSKFAGMESKSSTSNVHTSSKARTNQLLSSSQCQSSFPAFRLRNSDFTSNIRQTLCENSSHSPVPAIGSSPAKMLQQDSASTRPSPGNNSGLMNFSHFSRPVALVKANLAPTMGFSGKLGSNEKVSITSSSPIESSMVESATGSRNVAGFRGQTLSQLPKANLQSPSKPPQDPLSVEHAEAICQEDASRNRSPERVLCRSLSFGASTALGRSESGKAFETVVTSSSVCSGNSAGRTSKDPKHGGKRKSMEVEESGYLSEDVEEELVDVKQPITRRSTNAKRSRAAEVHNLSERRRRDRINEKMRALQELIPNCNKVDKASMLDEAIEYLKTLQLQVQIMSMGSGLYMPPVMLPAGMQHMHAPHMAHFSPMGVGMGMGTGVGFGMGMLDMSRTSGCPLIPVPSVHGAQLPCSPISGTTGYPGIPGSGLPMFRIPAQGLPTSMPCRPYIPLSGFSAKTVSVPDMLGAASTVPLVPESATCSSSKEHMQNKHLQKMHKTRGDCLEIQASPQVTKECLQRNHQTSHGGSSAAPNTIIGSEVMANGTTSELFHTP